MVKVIFGFILLASLIVSLVSAQHVLPTDFSNSTVGLLEGLGDWAYTVTNGTFWALLLLGFCVVMYVATSVYSTDRALGFAGVIGLFGSLFLVSIGFMSWWLASMFILVGAILIVVMVISKSR